MLLKIEKLVYGGDGLARQEGRVALVPFTLPGEEVETEVTREKNDLLRGRAVEIRVPSPHRVEAPCPYYLRCGGCHYQHADYAFQLEQKEAILREVLRRVGKIDYDGAIGIVSGEPWHYRNRAQLHVENGAVGYFEIGSHRLCPVNQCPISSPKLNETIGVLTEELPRLPRFTTTLELFSNESEVQFSLSDRVPGAARSLFDRIATTRPIEYAGFRVSRNSFFQVNRFLIDQLVATTLHGLVPGAHGVDLYAGVGLFTLPLAGLFERVSAAEVAGSAHRDLEYNAQGKGNVAAFHKTAEDYLTRVAETPDVIVADPPRNGLGKQILTGMLRIRAPQIRIVSCDPATLARDLRVLLGAGYRLDTVTLVDLFPQTFHLETVVALSL